MDALMSRGRSLDMELRQGCLDVPEARTAERDCLDVAKGRRPESDGPGAALIIYAPSGKQFYQHYAGDKAADGLAGKTLPWGKIFPTFRSAHSSSLVVNVCV